MNMRNSCKQIMIQFYLSRVMVNHDLSIRAELMDASRQALELLLIVMRED